MRYRNVHVIINPAAGQDRPVLGILARSFSETGADWEIHVTKKAGDARLFADTARLAGADVVVVHGGDGTVGEVASALVGTELPLAIIPGGTANALASELGIPGDIPAACALLTGEGSVTRLIDVGYANDRYFFVRAGIGLEATMVEGADRGMRDRFGPLSYVVAGLLALRNPAVARYTITLDGNTVEQEGVTCLINNAGALGAAGLRLAPHIDLGDGLLDVVVLSAVDFPSLLAATARMVIGAEPLEPLLCWQAREVEVTSDPPQTLQIDGELIEPGPLRARVLPGSLRVIVPRPTGEPDRDEALLQEQATVS